MIDSNERPSNSKTRWFCIRCNAYVPEELGLKKKGKCPECKRETRFFPSLINIEPKTNGELMGRYNVWEHTYDKKTGEIVSSALKIPCLAELIFHEFNLHIFTTRDNEEIWTYNGSYYEPNGEQIIKNLVECLLEDETSEHIKKEVVGYIRDKNYKGRAEFNPPLHLINVKNGIFNIKTGKLEKHTPKYFFINEIPVIYRKGADCAKIKKFFSQVVYKKDIPILQELFGYCLYRRYPIHKIVMFLGGGKNGKSTTIRLLIKFLGTSNVSGKELQHIINYRFAAASLYGKLANIAADITDKSLRYTGLFKSLTGEDLVNAEKKYKNDFDFFNYAKFIFSANTLPMSKDESYAFYRRWILISFPNTFEGKKCDKDILEKITTENELSGLFNWAIEGLTRLLKNGDFSNSQSVEQIMEKYKIMSDPLYAYTKEYLKCETDRYILKEELREHYVRWSKKNKLPIIPKNILTQRLGEHLSEMRTGKVGSKGKQKPAYMNIIWKNDVEETGRTGINLDIFPTGGIE